jgi:hypothetical protein
VFLTERVVRDLRMIAIEGFTALRRRGLEVGGLLFGDPSGGNTRIDGFEEAPCEHRYGPSYALSDMDREKLTVLLMEARKLGRQVAGFYRSVTGRNPVIEPADEALVAEYFPDGEFVFLLLQPLSAENCVATFRFVHDGQLLPAPEEPAIAFEPTQMAAMELLAREEAPTVPPGSRVKEEPEAEPEPATAPVPPFSAWYPEAVPPRAGRWKAVLICLVAALSAIGGYELAPSQSAARRAAPQWAELHLDVRPADGKLEVTWDRDAVRSMDATRGMLTISDVSSQRDIELGAAELLTGRYIHRAENPNIAVRMTLSAKGRVVASESTRLGPATPAAASAPIVPIPREPEPAAGGDLRAAVPPVAVHEVQPRIPRGIRSRISRQIVIPVEVQVSEHGRVVSAKVKDPSAGALQRDLATRAEKAAREWRFTPARTRAGRVVAARKTIRFVFAPASN